MNRNYTLRYEGNRCIFGSPLMILECIFENCDIIYTFGNEIRMMINVSGNYYKVFVTSDYIDITQTMQPNIHLVGKPVTYFNSQLKELENDPQTIMQDLFLQMKNLVGKIVANNYRYEDTLLESIVKIPKNPYK